MKVKKIFHRWDRFLWNELPQRDQDAHKVAAQALHFELMDGILYCVDTRPRGQKWAVVPRQLRGQILKENHGGHVSGHFSGPRLYSTLAKRWLWQGMYSYCVSYCKKCPQCVIVGGTGRTIRPPLKPIPVNDPFRYWELCYLVRAVEQLSVTGCKLLLSYTAKPCYCASIGISRWWQLNHVSLIYLTFDWRSRRRMSNTASFH